MTESILRSLGTRSDRLASVASPSACSQHRQNRDDDNASNDCAALLVNSRDPISNRTTEHDGRVPRRTSRPLGGDPGRAARPESPDSIRLQLLGRSSSMPSRHGVTLERRGRETVSSEHSAGSFGRRHRSRRRSPSARAGRSTFWGARRVISPPSARSRWVSVRMASFFEPPEAMRRFGCAMSGDRRQAWWCDSISRQPSRPSHNCSGERAGVNIPSPEVIGPNLPRAGTSGTSACLRERPGRSGSIQRRARAK